jgi:hypothetical protein
MLTLAAVTANGQDKLFVVTNRQAEVIDGEGTRFLNRVAVGRELSYLTVTRTGEDFYFEEHGSLPELIAVPPQFDEWAVWVHGDGQTFEISMDRALEIQQLHGVNLIVFAWPTRAPDKGPIGNFKNSLRHAEESIGGLHLLMKELEELGRVPGNPIQGRLSIFFHSLGCYLLKESVESGALDDLSPRLFRNLVINAAATDAAGHDDWIERLNIQERIFVTYNDEDINLEGLRVISSLGTQLGERPEPPLAQNAIYLDFTESVGFRFPTGATHSYYFDAMTRESENIRLLYTDLFRGLLPPEERFIPEENNLPGIYRVRF